MNQKNFKSFLIEIGFRFDDKQPHKSIESIYKSLIDIEYFDGVKKISQQDGTTSAILSSSDDALRVIMTNFDVSFIYKDTQLTNKFKFTDPLILDVMNSLRKAVGELKINAMRSNRLLYSTDEVDLLFLKNELTNKKYTKYVDNFDIWLEYEYPKISDLANTLTISISDQHSTTLHQVFDEQGRADELEDMVIIGTATGIFSSITDAIFDNFLQAVVNDNISSFALEKLGYGKK